MEEVEFKSDIQAVRKLLNIGLKEFSDAIGANYHSFQNIDSGRTTPPVYVRDLMIAYMRTMKMYEPAARDDMLLRETIARARGCTVFDVKLL